MAEIMGQPIYEYYDPNEIAEALVKLRDGHYKYCKAGSHTWPQECPIAIEWRRWLTTPKRLA